MPHIDVKKALFDRALDPEIFETALPALRRACDLSPQMKESYTRALEYWVTPSDKRSLGGSQEGKLAMVRIMLEFLSAAYRGASDPDERDALLVIFANTLVFSPSGSQRG
jgi:hypothetical protein